MCDFHFIVSWFGHQYHIIYPENLVGGIPHVSRYQNSTLKQSVTTSCDILPNFPYRITPNLVHQYITCAVVVTYKGCLKSSWTHLGGAVMVSFSKYLPWQVMHFLQRSAHFSKTCCRSLITSKYLALELPFYGWKSPEIAWGEIWTVWRLFIWGSADPLFPNRTQNSIRISSIAFLGFSNHEKGAPRQEISKWSMVCSTFLRSGWSVVKSALFAKGGTLEKTLSPYLHKVQIQSNNVSPRTLQTALIIKYDYVS
jgi:hypothetical protein